jgi:hypothetical protein
VKPMVSKPSLSEATQMDIQENARSSPASRALLVRRVQQSVAVAEAVPHRIPIRTDARVVEAMLALRRQRWSGPQIAVVLDVPRSTFLLPRRAQ